VTTAGVSEAAVRVITPCRFYVLGGGAEFSAGGHGHREEDDRR